MRVKKKGKLMKKNLKAKKTINKEEKDPLDRDMSWLIKKQNKFVRLSDLLKTLPKDKTISLRLSVALVSALKEIAKRDKIKYQKLIRNILSEYVEKAS